jgi:DNA-binding beta-propeller fold protein YncE/mono/diheme cytochrome c family protein
MTKPRNTGQHFGGALIAMGLLLVLAFGVLSDTRVPVSAADKPDAVSAEHSPDLSPVDLVLTADETRAIVVNQTANSIMLVDLVNDRVLSTAACGERPSNLAITPDSRFVLATAMDSGELIVFSLANDQLDRIGAVRLGSEPRGVTVSPDGSLAYVALSSGAAVAVIDIKRLSEIDRIAVGQWPRFLALSPDGRRLAVGCSGDGGVAVVDTETRKQLFLERFVGLNFGQMQVSADCLHVYFPWIIYRHNPITEQNIRRGWVLASRIARVRLDEHVRREAIALDPEGRAVGDPHGLALSPDEQTLVCTASGTHELLIFKTDGLPYRAHGGNGDHIDPDLLRDSERFARVPLGGRPLSVRYSKHGDKVFVVNSLLDAIQVVDVTKRELTRTIQLGNSHSPSLARQGEAIFYDAGRSLDQWYSCHSCHYEGQTNAVTMDTRNDGRFGNFKTVLNLHGAAETGPWFWHGWSNDFPAAVRQSLIETMLGPEPSDHDVAAVTAFIRSLKPRPVRTEEVARNDPAVTRGEAVFQSEKAGCATCHPAPLFTDGQNHDVGLGDPTDAYPTYNTPSLRGVSDRVRFLHTGSARSLRDVLIGPHAPERVTGQGQLSEQELADLLVYLETL